jgi:hypothetical protein
VFMRGCSDSTRAPDLPVSSSRRSGWDEALAAAIEKSRDVRVRCPARIGVCAVASAAEIPLKADQIASRSLFGEGGPVLGACPHRRREEVVAVRVGANEGLSAIADWAPVAYTLEHDGGAAHPLGQDAVGSIVYTPQARVSVNIMRTGRTLRTRRIRSWHRPRNGRGRSRLSRLRRELHRRKVPRT